MGWVFAHRNGKTSYAHMQLEASVLKKRNRPGGEWRALLGSDGTVMIPNGPESGTVLVQSDLLKNKYRY